MCKIPNPEGLTSPEVAGAILAGGRSRRMGRDKALLPINGQPLIGRLAERLQAVTDLVYICANERDRYSFLGLRVIQDLFPGQGPLAGLHAALIASPRAAVLLVACDMPMVEDRLLRALMRMAEEGYDAIVPCSSSGRIQPLCGLYRASCLIRVESMLKYGIREFSVLLEGKGLAIRLVRPAEAGFDDACLVNLNTPADFERYSPNPNYPNI